jgi:23S rRNA (guanine745-N1)-methyltransferase
MASPGRCAATALWSCPVCRARLTLQGDERRWSCPVGHSFDVAREGYVNLLIAGQRRSHQPGDSAEMVAARHRFLATGAFDPMSESLADVVGRERPTLVLDVGCGEGRHTKRLDAPLVLGVDVAKPAVALAARAHHEGWYAVASAANLPLDDAAADVALNVFGPVVPAELARVVRPGGVVVALHPGPAHLASLRDLVYAQARPHEVKPPLRGSHEWFVEIDSVAIRFPIEVREPALLSDLFTMTPYRWHAPLDIRDRLSTAAAAHFETSADVRVTTYRRTAHPNPSRQDRGNA